MIFYSKVGVEILFSRDKYSRRKISKVKANTIENYI